MRFMLHHRPLSAFTLMEMAVALIVVGLMATFVLKAGDATKDTQCLDQTRSQLAAIRSAVESFANNNQRYPRPANRSLGNGDPAFGQEVALADIAVKADVIANGGNPVYSGALPFQTLGLPEGMAADCWGNKFSYFVTGTLTNSIAGAADGVITIHGGTLAAPTDVLTHAAYVVISHGENALGAVAKNYTGSAHGWCDAGATLDSHNCDGKTAGGDAVLYDATFNNSAAAGADFFDDIVVFGAKKFSNCNAASYPVSWSVGADHCSATVPGNLVHTQTVGAASTVPVGNAQFKCINGDVVPDNSVGASCNSGTCSGGGHGGGGSCGAPCSDQLLSWGSGCSATFVGIPTGNTSPATASTAPGYTGTATASCVGGWTPPVGSCTP